MQKTIQLNAELHPSLLSYEQAARYLNVSESTVKRLVAAKKLRKRKIMGRSLIAIKDLEEFVEGL
jgi:excisionase family DNA binding protein